jgi:YHS domain-containing protein
MATDPVCGMQVKEKEAKWSAEHDGKTYYFCSPGCLKAFENSPEQYLDEEAGAGGHGHHGG